MVEINYTPKEYWASESAALRWLDRIEKIKQTKPSEIDTNAQSLIHFIKEVSKYDFKSFLEVGAGDGRLIGTLSNENIGDKFCSIDINKWLSQYVSSKYPKVKTSVGDIACLPFEDDEFDLVYTYQVLQHVPPAEIDKALSELLRVAKKEVWLFEGYDPEIDVNGFRRKGTDGGTFSWFFDRMIDCYSVETPKSEKLEKMGVRLYKIKV